MIELTIKDYNDNRLMGETMVTGNPIIDPKITMGTACCNLKTGNYIWSNGDITHTYIDMIIYIYICNMM